MSELYHKYWGKAQKNDDGTYDYHLLVYHCLDVAAVGSALFKLNPNIIPFLAQLEEKTQIDIGPLLRLLLSIHDFGKFAKNFQSKIPEVQFTLQGKNRGVPIPVRHDEIGVALWKTRYMDKLADRLFDKYGNATFSIVEILSTLIYTTAGHHGIPVSPDSSIIVNMFFDYIDYESIELFWIDLIKLFDVDFGSFLDTKLISLLEHKEAVKLASWEIAGFITFSDWIGSNNNYIKPVSRFSNLDDYWNKALENAEIIIADVGLNKAAVKKTYSFGEFLPRISKTPTPLQFYCDTCKLSESPQLWILEDVTGAGKTEAALILAARLASKGLGNGFFIALPTMATSNAMYKRFSSQYCKLFENGSKPSLVLAHGARHLSKEFRDSFLPIIKEDDSEINELENSTSHCNRWFADSNKKALLADTGVGTIDQLLVSVLPARHQSLRLFGLQGKILIIDEVHAYDSYQHRLLCGLLEYHSSSGGSVILLSATLPIDVRKSFASAYIKGTGNNVRIGLQNENYPLATCISTYGSDEKEQDTRSDLKRTVTVQFEDNYNKIHKILINEANNGKCCCWIRNTVSDASKSYEEIKNIYPCDKITLIHSRFTYADRLKKEGELLELFGPESDSETRNGRIVISTQIIEQSLDVDFDIMITDLAPIDYIIQRIGRLCRHKRDKSGNRSETDMRGKPELIIYGPLPDDEPSLTWYSEKLNGASFVYKDHAVLWKTQKALLMAGKKITTPGNKDSPDGIRELINNVYGDKSLITPKNLQRQEDDALNANFARDSIGRFNLLSLKEGYSPKSSQFWGEEVLVPTRIGESQIDVYLTKSVENELRPFEEGEYSWDLSTVKVRDGLIKELVFSENDQDLINELKKSNKRLFEKDVVIPLRFKNGIWCCDVEHKTKGPNRIMYDNERGFQVVKD